MNTTLSKEDILNKVANDHSYNDWGEAMYDTHPHTQVEYAGIAMDEYAKETAIGFYKWNALTIFEYVTLLRENIYNEKLKEIEEFELSSIEERFYQYLKTLQP